MSDLPYPFSPAEGRFYHVALGNGEYVRVALAGDYDIELRRRKAWHLACLHALREAHPDIRAEDIQTEADHLFYKALEDGV